MNELKYTEFLKFKEQTNTSLTSLQQQLNHASEFDTSDIYKEIYDTKEILEEKINNISHQDYQVTLYRRSSVKPDRPPFGSSLSVVTLNYNWNLTYTSVGNWYQCVVIVDGNTNTIKEIGDVVPVNTSSEGSGSNGLSAYEIAVKNGFVGTELQWLMSLKGEKGDPASGSNVDLDGYNVKDVDSNHNSFVDPAGQTISLVIDENGKLAFSAFKKASVSTFTFGSGSANVTPKSEIEFDEQYPSSNLQVTVKTPEIINLAINKGTERISDIKVVVKNGSTTVGEHNLDATPGDIALNNNEFEIVGTTITQGSIWNGINDTSVHSKTVSTTKTYNASLTFTHDDGSVETKSTTSSPKSVTFNPVVKKRFVYDVNSTSGLRNVSSYKLYASAPSNVDFVMRPGSSMVAFPKEWGTPSFKMEVFGQFVDNTMWKPNGTASVYTANDYNVYKFDGEFTINNNFKISF